MIYPIFYVSLCAIAIFWVGIFIWLHKSDLKLKRLFMEYNQALLSGDKQLAKAAGKRYYAAITFGKFYPNDEQYIESDIKKSRVFMYD